MVKLEYTDEATFKTEYIDFADEHYEFAKILQHQYCIRFGDDCSSLMVSSDKVSLIFCVNLGDKYKDREAYIIGKNLYRVKIEPI